jgi:hypothetical protein
MDGALLTRWKAGITPFDDRVVISEELTVGDLLPLLAAVVSALWHAHHDAELCTLLDWHEHDGYVTSAEPASWDQVVAAVATVSDLIAWSSDDTFVRRLVYAADFSFVLRWCVSSEPDDFGLPPGQPAGQFDVTGSATVVDLVARLVPNARVERARTFFDHAWAG